MTETGEKIDSLQAHQFLQTVNRKEPRPLTGVEIFDGMALQMEEPKRTWATNLTRQHGGKTKKRLNEMASALGAGT